MLQALRSSAASIVAKAVIGLLVVSFGIWGIQGYIFQAQRSDFVATVGDLKVTGGELRSAFQRDLSLYRQRGLDLTPEQARSFGLLDQTLDRLISGRLYVLAGDWMGMTVNDARVSKTIRTDPSFLDESGNFSRGRFELLLRQSNLTEAQWIAETRRDIVRREILNSIDISGDAPDALVAPLHAWRNEKRIAAVMLVPVDSTLDVGEPDAAAIEKLHNDLAGQFTAPERRVISYVHVTPELAAKDVLVSDEQIRQNYENRIEEFREPEKRSVQQIRVADEEAAKTVHEAISGGQDFAAAAREFAGQEAADLELGTFTAATFPIPEVADTIATLDTGEISDPLQSPFGWHVFRVTEIVPERTKPLEDVKERIESDLRAEATGDAIYSLATALEDELAGGATLEAAAGTIGAATGKTAAMDLSGNGKDGKPLEGLPGGEFLAVAFQSASGEISQRTETPEGGYFILRVDAVAPSALRPLDEVRDDIAAAWKADRRREAAQARALGIVQRIEDGGKLTKISAAEGLAASESKPFDRRGGGAESELVAPALVSDIFRVLPGQAAMADAPAGYVVAQLKEIVPADPATTEEIATVLGNAMVSDILEQFNAGLREKFAVDIDQAAVARLF